MEIIMYLLNTYYQYACRQTEGGEGGREREREREGGRAGKTDLLRS